ncbi:magnesium chelatase domain-containing protein [Thalassospira lucentensis]|uniref:magnesium chelatase domain-containing protein n=1 Tax=Thalassospira lucentensis TaxID=168935 RepID=UPI0009DBFBD2
MGISQYDSAGSENRKRVRSAFLAMGLAVPTKCISINFASENLPTEGSHFDLLVRSGLRLSRQHRCCLAVCNTRVAYWEN